ncbi:MAG: hypothetical protein RBS80_06565 [Thermoguttaceae bacterium]|nr:hypothetical protein [Thermoguttaceae bacterium]
MVTPVGSGSATAMSAEGTANLPAVVLPREVTLFEYDTCADRDEAALLFHRKEHLEPYLTAQWLVRSFDEDRLHIGASHYVGLLPFGDEDGMHLLLIAPKGCRQEPRLGLLRFLELLALGEGETPPEDVPGWEGQLGPHPFLLFLARHYAQLLQELCRRDFRAYYRKEEAELRSHIRGRLHLAGYVRGALRGKPHVLPCRWEEFTVDNWDNRILWAAARRLQRVAAALDPGVGASVWEPFQKLLPWFSGVEEVSITSADLRKARLERTSRVYRRAMAWARLLLRGSDLPSPGGQAPSLALDANRAFERFAEVIAQAALPDATWQAAFCNSRPFLSGQQHQVHEPDIVLWKSQESYAVGDAKYKDVLERAMTSQLASGEEVLRVCIRSADWNQLYVYMRLYGASCGFFVVPFWNMDGQPFEWLDNFHFAVPPCDGHVRVAVLAINLLQRRQSLKDVKRAAADRLREWIAATVQRRA